MKLGKIKSFSVKGNDVEIAYEDGKAVVSIITEDIYNFFVPLFSDEHYSKAIEGDKHKKVEFTASFDEKDGAVTITAPNNVIKVSEDFYTVIFERDGVTEVLSDYVGERHEKHVLGQKMLDLIAAEGHDISGLVNKEKPVTVLKKMSKKACFYGMGDKTGFLNKHGYEYENWNSDIPQAHNEDYRALYKSVPFFVCKDEKHTFGLFFDNTFHSYMDMCKESADYFTYEADGGNLDYYFLNGGTIKQVVSEYAYLTGTAPLPKLWTLGLMQCRWGYENEEDISEIADGFRKNSIPCESVQYDIDYMEGYRVFTWDEKAYGKRGELFKDLKDNHGFKPVVIVDPGVKNEKGYFMSDEGHENGYFAKDPQTKEDYVNAVWPGESNFPDFGLKKVRDWWGKHIKTLTDMGVEGIWNDMNEPASFNGPLPLDVIFHDGDRETTQTEIHNVYGHYMSMATYEGLKEATGERPFVITRACYSGTQKYSTVWTGDNQSLWSHLQMMLPQLMNLGLSGYAIAGVDIGGFGADSNPELMARWIEAACMATFFRNHSAKGTMVQEPWRFGPEVLAIYRKYTELHYRFLPYIYDLLKHNEETGIPPMRPLVLEYEDDPVTVNMNGEFLYGENMLIAPVLEPGISEKLVYIPEGTWYDYWTGERTEGRKWIIKDAPLDVCPIYIKAGSIIPTYEVCQYIGQKEYDRLTLLKTPGAAEYVHYQDNGRDFKYRDGEYNLYKFNVSEDGSLSTEMLHKGYKVYADVTVVCLT